MPWLVLFSAALMVAAALGALVSLAVFLEPMERPPHPGRRAEALA